MVVVNWSCVWWGFLMADCGSEREKTTVFLSAGLFRAWLQALIQKWGEVNDSSAQTQLLLTNLQPPSRSSSSSSPNKRVRPGLTWACLPTPNTRSWQTAARLWQRPHPKKRRVSLHVNHFAVLMTRKHLNNWIRHACFWTNHRGRGSREPGRVNEPPVIRASRTLTRVDAGRSGSRTL